MTLLDTVNVGETDYGVQSRVPMGTCATPAGSEVKVCAFADNFSLSVGNLIAVTFTYANTYGDGSTTYPKLTVNGVQYPVKFPTGEYASDGAWANGQAVTFMFDGTNLLMTTLPVVNTVEASNMHAVTSSAVAEKLSYDYADYTAGEVVYTIEVPYVADTNNTNMGSILINARYGFRYMLDYYNFINEPVVATTNARIARLRMLDGGIDGGNYLEPTLKWNVDTTNKKIIFYLKKQDLNTTLSFKILQEIKGISTVKFGKTTDLTVYNNASYSRAFEYLSPVNSVTSGEQRPVTSGAVYWAIRNFFNQSNASSARSGNLNSVTYPLVSFDSDTQNRPTNWGVCYTFGRAVYSTEAGESRWYFQLVFGTDGNIYFRYAVNPTSSSTTPDNWDAWKRITFA